MVGTRRKYEFESAICNPLVKSHRVLSYLGIDGKKGLRYRSTQKRICVYIICTCIYILEYYIKFVIIRVWIF